MLRIGVAGKCDNIRRSPLQSNEQLNYSAAENIQSVDAILPLQHASPDVPEQERVCQPVQAASDEQINILSSPAEIDSCDAKEDSHSSLVSIQILSLKLAI